MQTLKSASPHRVIVGIATNDAAARLAGHFPALCPTGAPDLQNDVYGRNVGHLGVDMRGAPECNLYAPPGQSVVDHITRENLERPYVSVGSNAVRGGDLMGVGRDMIPQNLYGEGERGNFVIMRPSGPHVSHGTCPKPPIHRIEQNTNYPPTHDATSGYIYRG